MATWLVCPTSAVNRSDFLSEEASIGRCPRGLPCDGSWQDSPIWRTHNGSARTRRFGWLFGFRRPCFPVLIPPHRIHTLAVDRHGSGTQTDGKEWIHYCRCDARTAQVHAIHVASAATGRGNRHYAARPGLRGPAAKLRSAGRERASSGPRSDLGTIKLKIH